MATITTTPARSSGKLLNYFVYAVVCFLLGSNWPIVRVLVRDIPPLRAAGYSYGIAAVITILATWPKRNLRPHNGAELRRTIGLGFAMLAIPTAAVSWAEQYINASLTAVIFAGLPLAVTLISRFTTGRKVPYRAVIAMIVGAVGIAVIFFDGVPHSTIGRLGALAVAGATLSCAFGVAHAGDAAEHLTSPFSTGIQFTFNAALVLVLSLILEPHRASNWNLMSISALVFSSVFCTALLVLLYYWLLRRIETFQVATIDLVVPVVSFLEGVYFLRESVTTVMIVAAAVVLASTAYVLRTDAAD